MDYPKHIVNVAGVIENEQGEILMIKSTYRPGWEPPGGIVEEGEDAVAALIREVKEETGYEVKITRLVSVLHNTGSPGHLPKIGLVFMGLLAGGEARTSAESAAVGWYPPAEALALAEVEAMKMRLRDALPFSGNVKFRAYKSRPEYQVNLELG